MKKIKVLVSSLVAALSFVPALAFAQNLPLTSFNALLSSFEALMPRVIALLISVAIIVFLYGMLKFILNANDADKRKEGRSFMIWAIIAIVVMVSVWGLVVFVQSTFGLGSNGGHPAYPTI